MPSSTPQLNGAHAASLALPLSDLADAALSDDDEGLDPVPPLPASKMPSRKTPAQRQAEVGDLVDEDQDKMVMHTKEGMFLFAGRAHDAKNQVSGIVGGRRAAAAARSIWMLSSNDNPYAEWGLISTSAAMETAGA